MIRVTFLGTGTSHGVPMIGCDCPTCHSPDARDRRWRSSILVASDEGANVLVDTTPDLRAQALACGLRRVDAILYTHAHADHILGLDEMRRFNDLQRRPIPCYGDAATLDVLVSMFGYIFQPRGKSPSSVPRLTPFTIGGGPFCLGRLEVTPVPLRHGPAGILGYRFGRFAYLTDCSAIPDASWALLGGLDVLVLDALRDRPHPMHFTVRQAVEAATRIGARRTLFTHICHDLPHEATCARLPAGVELAYDGLTIETEGA